MDLDRAERVAKDLLRELAGGEGAEILGKGEDEGEVNAGFGEELKFARERGDEWGAGGAFASVEHVGGVGVEGDYDGAGVQDLGPGSDLRDDGLVADVDAVKVADRDNGGLVGAGQGGELGEGVGDLHVGGNSHCVLATFWLGLRLRVGAFLLC